MTAGGVDPLPQPPRAALPESTGSRRLAWSAMPRDVATAIERMLGSQAVSASSQEGGFSAGIACRLRLADGRRAFVKAVNASAAPGVAEFHRKEIKICSRLPSSVPAPAFIGSYDDGTWVALIFEDIDGYLPAQPWRREELDRVLDAATGLAELLTPSPIGGLATVPPRLGGWQEISEDPPTLAKLATSVPWAIRNLDSLLALETRTTEAARGDTLLHGDLYPFNTLLTRSGVVFVDWPHSWVGANFADVVTLLGSVALSGMDPQSIAGHHPLTARVEPGRLDALLSAQSGFLLARACLAEPDADPRLVKMMFALGQASLAWLARRL